MFQVNIRYNVKSDIVLYKGDEAFIKSGFLARKYVELLKRMLPTIMDPDTVFIYNNARVYIIRVV